MEATYLKILRKSWCCLAILLIVSLISGSCLKERNTCYSPASLTQKEYKTQNVFIVVVDGLRYSEGWGDSIHQYIPRMDTILASQGIIDTRFYNKGGTYTLSGHTSLTTGIYQTINNGGLEYPQKPSIFQYWNQQYHTEKGQSWVISSKGKLAVLGDCTERSWKGKFTPSVNAGIDGGGVGAGYRDDSLTLKTVIEILNENHPHLVLINFREPDCSGHTGVWADYIKGVRSTDEYVYQLWRFLQTDSNYQNKTTLFVTNDHGRHLDSVANGFVGHGDDCDGCRHLNFYATGPDFKKGIILDVEHEQIDIPATIAELMNFTMPTGKGRVMEELFEQR